MFSTRKRQDLKFLKIQDFTLKKMGIDINTLERKELIKNYGKFAVLISCVLYLEFALINFVVHCGVTNLDMAAGSLSLFNQGFLILIKISLFIVKGNGFMKLIWDINQLAEKANSRENEKWLSENLRAQLIGRVYFYACWVAVICSGIFPLILMAFYYKQNNSFSYKLPFGGKFPGEQFGILVFMMNYILSLIYIYGMLNMTVGVDTLYGWYIHSISAHFRILRCKIESLTSKLRNNDCSNFTQEMGSIVDYHNRVLQFVLDLNNIFGEILWAEVVLSSLQMCFAVYTLNNDDDITDMPFNFMVVVAVIMQLMIYCFGGEKIKDESLMLSLDVYLLFPWHKLSPKEKKLLLLPLMRSQRLSVLTGLFFEVDRALLVYIFKTAFSFNALLSAMKE